MTGSGRLAHSPRHEGLRGDERAYNKAVALLFCLSGLWLLVTVAAVGVLQFEIGDMLVWMLVLTGVGWALCAVWVAIPILSGIYAIRLFLAGPRCRALQWLSIPVFAVAVILFGVPVSGMIRFATQYSAYSRIADDASHGKCTEEDRKHWAPMPEFVDCDNPPLILFDLGGLGSSWHGILYDASDEIRKPSRDRSTSWKQRDLGSLLSCSATSADLSGHFYFAGGSFSTSATACD